MLGEDSFERFCKDFGIKYLCEAPIGVYGRDWGHTEISDKEIILQGLEYGDGKCVFCSEFGDRREEIGRVGHPVLLLANCTKVALEFVRYVGGAVYADVCGMGLHEKTYRVALAELRALKPVMAGITISMGEGEDRFYICAPIIR